MMRITDLFETQINELMDQPYRFMPLGQLRGKAKYAFETDAGNVYIVDIVYPEGEATIGFGLKDLKSTGRLDKVQGTGDAMRVFSTVVEIVKQFVEKVQPPKIHFDAASNEPSRIKLYQRMAMSVDRALPNYTFVGQEPGEHTVKFTLAKKESQA
jgi:hypothetical protein